MVTFEHEVPCESGVHASHTLVVVLDEHNDMELVTVSLRAGGQTRDLTGILEDHALQQLQRAAEDEYVLSLSRRKAEQWDRAMEGGRW